MANALRITVRDRDKTAICREVLALCGEYTVTLAGDWPASTNGFIVLHRILPPDAPLPALYEHLDLPVEPTAENQVYCTAAVTSGSASLSLKQDTLVGDLTRLFRPDQIAQVRYTVYCTETVDGTSVQNLVASGLFDVKVSQPYGSLNAAGTGFELFRGAQGNSISEVTYASTDSDGNALHNVYVGTGSAKTNVGTIKAPIGPQGIQGNQGNRGLSISDIEFDSMDDDGGLIYNVYVGTGSDRTYVGSFKAPRGLQGEQGETGPAGQDGVDGSTGAQGPQGEKGDTGDTGAPSSLSGQTMEASPNQRQITVALKKIWRAMGGTVEGEST